MALKDILQWKIRNIDEIWLFYRTYIFQTRLFSDMQIFLEDRTMLDVQNIINLTKSLDAFVEKITKRWAYAIFPFFAILVNFDRS